MPRFVGPNGYQARKIRDPHYRGPDPAEAEDWLAVYNPLAPNYPTFSVPDNDQGRRVFLWAVSHYAEAKGYNDVR